MEQTVIGKYNTAKIFTNVVEQSAIEQIKTLCDQPFTQNSSIRIMPDVHAGAGCTIGTTMTISDTAVPNLVGVDIGCGMEVVRLKNKFIEVQKLDKAVHALIPAGFSVRGSSHPFAEEIDLNELYCADRVNIGKAYRSLGTLGGGNHFIEADKGADGGIYLVIHSGSRHLGLEVAFYYQEQAWKALQSVPQDEVRSLIERYKAEGREQEIESAIKALSDGIEANVPRQLAYVSGRLFDMYIHDMKIVQRFAMLNRKAMAHELIKELKLKVEDEFTTIHNYIDIDSMILRKGAIAAYARALAQELAPEVRVNTIAPGWIQTRWGASAPESIRARLRVDSLAQRWGEPREIASLARFLLSENASYVNGQTVEANGGYAYSGSNSQD